MKRGETYFVRFSDQEQADLKRWLEQEYPQLDFAKTLVRFEEHADKWSARLWTAKFKRVIRAGMDNGYVGICVYKNDPKTDPRWKTLNERAAQALQRVKH